VPSVFRSHKLIAILCLAALLIAVLAPSNCTLALAILTSFRFFGEALVLVSVQQRTEHRDLYGLLLAPPAAPRSPPIQ
jgi:hypothetical protein